MPFRIYQQGAEVGCCSENADDRVVGWMGYEGGSIAAAYVAQSLVGPDASFAKAVVTLNALRAQAKTRAWQGAPPEAFAQISDLVDAAVANDAEPARAFSALIAIEGQIPSDTIGDPSTFAADFVAEPAPPPRGR